ncbi:hypothetical protein [Pseudoalteromonas phage PH357]|nr:hypothetical protein [Pseudoalteromonas phage PH357]
MNRYKVSRLISDKMKELMYGKNLVVNNFKVVLTADKHLADRILDRKVDLRMFNRIIEKLFSQRVCEVLYASEVQYLENINRSSAKINVVYRDYLLPITVMKHEDRVYSIKVRTIIWHPTSVKPEYTIDIN